MAQDRMIRASMRSSEKVNSWPIPLRFFWTQLWGYCDDHGRGRYNAALIKSDAFPLDDEVTAGTVSRWMQALEIAGVIWSYEMAGKRYFECVNWDEHQEPPYYKRTDIPDSFGEIPQPSKRSKKSSEDSRNVPPNRRGRGIEVEVEGGSANAHPPVDNSEPSLYCDDHPAGTKTKCGPCGDARRAHTVWERSQKNRPTVVGIVTDPDCPRHPGRPARGCDRCAEEVA